MTFPNIDETHDPALSSWVEGADAHPDFPIQNLPYGIFSPTGGAPRAGVAIGNFILDLAAAIEAGLLPGRLGEMIRHATLNILMGSPAVERLALRRALSALLSDPGKAQAAGSLLHRASDCTMHLPATIGDYSDFYVGIHHATNVGKLFRPDNPLLPNYKYVPIGYHGRASSVRASDIPVKRPIGQSKSPTAVSPEFGPSRRLDYELELGLWVGTGNALGTPIPIAEAADHIAGFCLLNDWSARDFQTWEYQPLGPFLAKNFHSTISPWVVTAEALAPFRAPQPERAEDDPAPLPYLLDEHDQTGGALAVKLEVTLSTIRMRGEGIPAIRLSSGSATNMYWTPQQIVAHHASNGCNLQPGDLLGTGTISAPTTDGYGSLLELSEGGAKPILLPTGEERRFLEDGDEVALNAIAEAPGYRSIGFGECRAVIAPAG